MADNTNSLLNVWLEGQITEDGLNLALLSEKSGDGARVEAVEHISPDDLESRDGEVFTMNLGDSTVENLSEMREDANIGRMLQSEGLSEKAEHLPENPSSDELLAYMGLPEGERLSATAAEPTGEDPDGTVDTGTMPTAGEVLTDMNAPDWSDDDWVEVVEVMENVSADEYVIQGTNANTALDPSCQSWNDKTVADANPGYPADDAVVIGQYEGTGKHYAFPVSRLA